MTPPVVLSIAASDSGGGAGLAADLATFAELGVHGACVVTAVTAQDTRAVHRIHPIPVDMVAAQLDAVLEDFPVAVVKTGMLARADVVRVVAERCRHLRIVVDPVLRATSGAVLADEAVIAAYREHLLPAAYVSTPNAAEAQVLGPFATAHVVTGSETGEDVLHAGDSVPLPHDRIDTWNDHGTGCTFSAAVAGYTALGMDLVEAVRLAGTFTASHLRTSQDWALGHGRGPIAHTITRPRIHAAPTSGGTR